MIRMVNDGDPRSEVEKYFSEDEMKEFDKMRTELDNLKRENPRVKFWPVELDW